MEKGNEKVIPVCQGLQSPLILSEFWSSCIGRVARVCVCYSPLSRHLVRTGFDFVSVGDSTVIPTLYMAWSAGLSRYGGNRGRCGHEQE